MLRWIQNTGQIFQTLKRCLENDRPEKIIETGHREGDYEMLTDEHGKIHTGTGDLCKSGTFLAEIQ